MTGRRQGTKLLIWGCSLGLLFRFSAFGGDWPQLQHDARRSGYTEERLEPPFRVAWTRNFQPERVAGFVQPVISRGAVFVGTEFGNFYALDAATGRELWKFAAGSPIMHTAACAGDRVFFAALDGAVYALEARTGNLAWRHAGRRGYGFTAAPLVVDGRLFIGGRDGTFYALDLDDGHEAWTWRAEEPIFTTAAAGPNGEILVGAEDMRLRALSGNDGHVLWTSRPLNGQTLMNTHPVVAGGTILFRPMMNHLVKMMAWKPAFTPTWDKAEFDRRYQAALENGVRKGEMPPDLWKLQDEVVEYFRQQPEDQDLFLLDAATGRTRPVAPHFRVNSMHGPVAAPAMTADRSVVIPWTYVNHGWARLDLEKGRAVEFIVPPRPTNADETLNVSVAGNLVFIFHCEEANANHTGIYDLEKKRWLPVPAPPNRWGELADNLQPASHAVAIANGFFYHIVFHQLAAWKASNSAESNAGRAEVKP